MRLELKRQNSYHVRNTICPSPIRALNRTPLRLEFGTVQDTRPSSGDRAKTPSQVQHSNDIIAMLSPDGERVALGKGLKARGNVENWLGMVEENMMVTLRRLLKASIQDFEVSDKNDWVVRLDFLKPH